MKLLFITPQFTRPAGSPAPAAPPADREAFDALKTLPNHALVEMGMRQWGREHDTGHETTDTGPMLWLYPGEWYSSIPDGYEIVDIFFKKKQFMFGGTDNDIRFGCLSFGFTKE